SDPPQKQGATVTMLRVVPNPLVGTYFFLTGDPIHLGDPNSLAGSNGVGAVLMMVAGNRFETRYGVYTLPPTLDVVLREISATEKWSPVAIADEQVHPNDRPQRFERRGRERGGDAPRVSDAICG